MLTSINSAPLPSEPRHVRHRKCESAILWMGIKRSNSLQNRPKPGRVHAIVIGGTPKCITLLELPLLLLHSLGRRRA